MELKYFKERRVERNHGEMGIVLEEDIFLLIIENRESNKGYYHKRFA
jgi:hypothetical protein